MSGRDGGTIFKTRYGHWREGWEFAAFMACFLGGIGAFVIAVLLVVAYPLERHTCDRQTAAMDRDGYYGIFEGCMVQLDDGTYVPIDQLRRVAEDGGR